MYVRITRTDGLYDRDVVITFLCTGVVPTFASIPGYHGLIASADPITGAVWTVSVWEGPDTVRITDELSEHLREAWLATTHRQLRGVESYEVLGDAAVFPGSSRGCTLQVLPFTLTRPAELEAALEQVQGDLLPALRAQERIQAAQLLVDREDLEGMVCAVWQDAAAARSGLDATTEAQARVAERGVAWAEPVDQEIIFAHVLSRTP